MQKNGGPQGPLAHKVQRLARMDIPGGGQVVVHGMYAYVGHMDPPLGTSIIDVTDPRKPKMVGQIRLPDLASHSHKVRVVGEDLMIVNLEQNQRHFLRKGKRIPEVREVLAQRLGRVPTDGEMAQELAVKETDLPVLTEAARHEYTDGGFKIYDISDRANPRELSYTKTHGFGVHRFDADETYAYISTEMPGFNGNILVIYDIRNPQRPEPVSRWWLPGQEIAEGQSPSWQRHRNKLHHALRCGNELWAGCWYAGFRVIDVCDITAPRTVGSYDYHPPIPETTHTALRVPFPVAGKEIAVIVDEEHTHHRGQPHAFMWLFDVGDLDCIKPLSTFHVSELDSPWSRTPGARFGAHQCQEHMRDPFVYVTWFSGGLRIVDITDPLLPEEVGCFIPETGAGASAPQSNDVDVDERGIIYLIDRINGFDILQFNP